MSRADTKERLRSGRVGRLATVDDDGWPHLVPIVFAIVGETLYSAVDRKPKSSKQLKRLRNIHANPRVSILVDAYEEDWRRLWWVRADGRARVLEAGPERERAGEALKAKYPQYGGNAPDGPAIAVQLERLRGWRAR